VSLILTTSLVSVGASGGILAMLAAQVVVGNRLPAGRARTRTVSRPIGLAIPALLPFGTSTGGIQVDYGAHVGGAVLGIALGVFLLRTWRESEPLPGFRGVAMAAAIVALVSLAGTAFAVTLSYPARKSAVALIPASLVPHTKAERSANSYRLVSEYPGDPRSHMMVALMFYDEHNMPSAETELREALAQDDIYRTVLGPGLKNTIRFFLAETVMFEGRRADAVELARQACQAPFSSQPDRTVATVQMRARLCPP
jgi:rhomboid protease GluP